MTNGVFLQKENPPRRLNRTWLIEYMVILIQLEIKLIICYF